jgi:hypothetical protein
MTAILELLGRQRKQRVGTSDDVLATAAREHAAGKEIDVAVVEAALHDLGKPIEHFGEVCRIAAVRRDALAAFERFGTATTKQRRLTAAMDAERTKHEAARAAYLSRMAALEADAAEAGKLVSKAQQARETLLQTANVIGSLRPQYEEALSAREEATAVVGDLRRDLRQQQSRLREAERWIDSISRSADKEIRPVAVFANKAAVPPAIARQLEPHELDKRRAQQRMDEIATRLREAEDRLDRAERAVVAIETAILQTR